MQVRSSFPLINSGLNMLDVLKALFLILLHRIVFTDIWTFFFYFIGLFFAPDGAMVKQKNV